MSVFRVAFARIWTLDAAGTTNDVVNDPRVGDREWARREGMVSFAGFPLVVFKSHLG